MSTGLEIVAVGARTPVGLSAESSAASVRAAISRLQEAPFATPQGEPVVVASDLELGGATEGRDRLLPMMEHVLDEVFAKIGNPTKRDLECDVYLALPEARPGFADDDAKYLAQMVSNRLHHAGVVAKVHVAGRGHAGALTALHRIVQLAPRRENAVSLILASDSYHCVDTYLWLEAAKRFAQPGVRGGFVPGEGAACVAIVQRAVRRSLGLPCLAMVHGVGTSRESQLRDGESGSLGLATTAAVRTAAAGLRLPDEAPHDIYCDINGERYRSEDWGFFALRGSAFINRPTYIAPCDCWGDTGAAFGALGTVLAVQSFERGYAKGSTALVMAGSDGGDRAAAFFRATP